MNFDFTNSGNVYAGRYVAYQFNPPLKEWQAGERIGMWVKAKGDPYRVIIRIIDRNGEVFQSPPLLEGSPDADWKYVTTIPADNWGHWGGDKNGKIDYPARVFSLVVDKSSKSASYQTKGSFYVDDITIHSKGEGEFAGQVLDDKGAVVANVEIKIYYKEKLVNTIRTDEKGMFSLRLPLGTYSATFSKPGYLTEGLEFRITNHSITERNLRLKGE